MSYALLDSGDFQKLEQVGPFRIIRPSPQAVWRPRDRSIWDKVDAQFIRFSGGEGKWTVHQSSIKKPWLINYGGLKFQIEITDFGHLGLFPEQEINWHKIRDLCAWGVKTYGDFQVLNLFAYTGGSTLAAAQGGASLVHVDASKTSVQWARNNAEANGLADRPIRWIVEDVQKFVARECRRGRLYHGIILDPPSFGRGAQGESWKIEEHLNDLLSSLKTLLHPQFKFILLSSHSNGYTPLAMQNLLMDMVEGVQGKFIAEEMVVREGGAGRALPSGASTWFIRD